MSKEVSINKNSTISVSLLIVLITMVVGALSYMHQTRNNTELIRQEVKSEVKLIGKDIVSIRELIQLYHGKTALREDASNDSH